MKQMRKRGWQIFIEDVHYNLRGVSFKRKLISFSKLLLLFFIVIGIPVLLLIFYRDKLFSKATYLQLPKLLGTHKVLGFILLTAMQVLQIVICILPGQPIQFASSYLYGVSGGYFIAIIGSIIGSIITYKIADYLGNDAIHIIFGKTRVNSYMKKLNSPKAFLVVFLIYLIPGIPKDLMSYVAGISDMKFRSFIIVSTAGRTPGLLGSLLVGYFWSSQNYLGIAAVALVTGIILYICYIKRNKIMQIIESYEEQEKE